MMFMMLIAVMRMAEIEHSYEAWLLASYAPLQRARGIMHCTVRQSACLVTGTVESQRKFKFKKKSIFLYHS